MNLCNNEAVKPTMKNIATQATIIIFIFLISFWLASPSFGQTGGQQLTIMPPKFELFANPGDVVSEKIRIRNESDFPATYAIIIEDFSSSGEEGHVVIEEEGGDSNYSLAKWIEPAVTQILLQPNEEQSINFNINIPRDAEPGGHYASILFASNVETLPGTASVSQRIGNLVLLRVSGNVSENANITTFEAPTNSQKGPVTFTLRLNNEGNVHVRPKGTIIITNFFGKKVEELPLQGANVLPGATRRMETTWEKDGLFGAYTATLVATYGQQNLPLTAATKFNVVSTSAMIFAVVALVSAFVLILSLISGRKRLAKAFKALTQG
jgi:hypothetical protein